VHPCGLLWFWSTNASLAPQARALGIKALQPSLSINTNVVMFLGFHLKTKRNDSHLQLTWDSNAPRYVLFEFRMKKVYKVQGSLVDALASLICETKIYDNLMFRWCIHVVRHGFVHSTNASLTPQARALGVEALQPLLSINTNVVMFLGFYLKTKRIDLHLQLTRDSNAPRYMLFEFCIFKKVT
jgi:hypothetical protein